MNKNNPSPIANSAGGVFQALGMRIKLVLRLMADSRVNPLLKLLPIGSLIYLVVPDLLIGPFDDAAIIWLGTYLFVELCPPDVVAEHMKALNSVVPGEWRDPAANNPTQGDEDVVDAEFWEQK
jgi:hypothetical protein